MKTLYAKVVTFDAGFEYDKEKIRANHKLGDVFEVTLVDMGGCHTDVYEGDKYYNSVFFDFFLDAECTKPHDIYRDPEFNPYLHRKHLKYRTMEKQIEEMAKNVCHLDRTCDECMTSFECKAMMYAKRFYGAGYRKASDVAEEIEKYILEGASKIESDNSDALYGAKFAIEKVVLPILEAYKKKYTEGGE